MLYTNPRGSTSYGEEFGNLIHHAYPGNDYDDLMSGVDAVLPRATSITDNLFVTGGSGGGVLTGLDHRQDEPLPGGGRRQAGHQLVQLRPDRRYVPVLQPLLVPRPTLGEAGAYLKRSPISLVGNITTPTMIITGEADHRTPMSESEQFYQALKLRKIDTALVRIPGASHDIAARPSHLIAHTAYGAEVVRDAPARAVSGISSRDTQRAGTARQVKDFARVDQVTFVLQKPRPEACFAQAVGLHRPCRAEKIRRRGTGRGVRPRRGAAGAGQGIGACWGSIRSITWMGGVSARRSRMAWRVSSGVMRGRRTCEDVARWLSSVMLRMIAFDPILPCYMVKRIPLHDEPA